MFSQGRSIDWVSAPINSAYDVAASVHIPQWATTVGLELNNDEREIERRDEANAYLGSFLVVDRRLGIHVARKMIDGLAVGLALRNYSTSVDQMYTAREAGESTAEVWDISLSVHGQTSAGFIGRPGDELRYGLTLDNALGSEISYIDEAQAAPLHQVFRAGIGYIWNPDLGRVLNSSLLSVLATVEGNVQGTKYEFRTTSGMGGGMEARLIEVLMLSIGMQTRSWLGDGEYEEFAFPVMRYGAGLDLPLDRIFNTDIPFSLRIDYAHTVWNSKLEDTGGWNADNRNLQDNVFSLQLNAGIL